jgi:hypothetical protein
MRDEADRQNNHLGSADDPSTGQPATALQRLLPSTKTIIAPFHATIVDRRLTRSVIVNYQFCTMMLESCVLDLNHPKNLMKYQSLMAKMKTKSNRGDHNKAQGEKRTPGEIRIQKGIHSIPLHFQFLCYMQSMLIWCSDIAELDGRC